jgi:hypothetical protein
MLEKYNLKENRRGRIQGNDNYLARVEFRENSDKGGYYSARDFLIFSIVPQVGSKIYIDSGNDVDYILECLGLSKNYYYLPSFTVEELVIDCRPIIIPTERTTYIDFLIRCVLNPD